MIKLFVILFVFTAIILAFEYLSIKDNQQIKEYNYKKKDFLMTRAEHEFFDILVSVIAKDFGNNYYVFPQIHISTLVDWKSWGQNWRGAKGSVDRYSVDYVLCDKNYIKPILAIELDDSSHERKDRVIRDKKIEGILKMVGLPLLRFENHGIFNNNEIAIRLKDFL